MYIFLQTYLQNRLVTTIKLQLRLQTMQSHEHPFIITMQNLNIYQICYLAIRQGQVVCTATLRAQSGSGFLRLPWRDAGGESLPEAPLPPPSKKVDPEMTSSVFPPLPKHKHFTMADQAYTTTDLQGALPLVARGKVRDLYEVDEKTLLFIATDRISAYDVIMENVSNPSHPFITLHISPNN